MNYKTLIAVLAFAISIFSCKKDDSNAPCVDPSKINTKVGCMEIYDPVCGCDNVTYGNACIAENYHGIKTFTKGPCKGDEPKDDGCYDPSKVDLSIPCPTVIDPVCACNGVTYNNACDAERNGMTNWTAGKCEIDTITQPCIEVCSDSCITLKTPRGITMQSHYKQSYTFRWRSVNPNKIGAKGSFTICPNTQTEVYLEAYITTCVTNKGTNNGFCGTTIYNNSGGKNNGILPGGCVIKRPSQMITRLVSVTKYCFDVKPCGNGPRY